MMSPHGIQQLIAMQVTEWAKAQCLNMTRALRFVLPEDASWQLRDAAEDAELAQRPDPSKRSDAQPAEDLPGAQRRLLDPRVCTRHNSCCADFGPEGLDMQGRCWHLTA